MTLICLFQMDKLIMAQQLPAGPALTPYTTD